MKQYMKGFTSVELIIALLISSVIIGFIYTVYHFSLSYSQKWKQKIELENNVFLGMNQCTADLREGMDVYSNDNTMFIKKSQDNIYYFFTADSLGKNNFRINSEYCKLDTFFLAVLGLNMEAIEDGKKIESISLQGRSMDSLLYSSDVLSLGLKMSNTVKSMELRSSVFLRNRKIVRFNRLLKIKREVE